MRGHHNDYKIKIWPQPIPNFWGGPTLWTLLKLTGFGHMRYNVKSRSREPYSMIYAFFNCVTQNRTVTEMQHEMGKKIYNIGHTSGFRVNSSDKFDM